MERVKETPEMDADYEIVNSRNGRPLYVLRSDTGDGGWSLHSAGQIAMAEIEGDSPNMLLSGPAQWDSATGGWNRPNAADIEHAVALIKK
jgi:hypothetical protein